MILRFRGRNGTYRLQVEPGDSVAAIARGLAQLVPNIRVETAAIAHSAAGDKKQLLLELSGTVEELGLHHGDLLYLTYQEQGGDEVPGEDRMLEIPPPNQASAAPKELVEDPVDTLLEKEDGKIYQSRSTLCRHAPKGMCDHCMPLEPYDAKYLAAQKIKHLSFHSYLRKINLATNKPELKSTYMAPLSEPDYRIRADCPSGHAPWPEGICTKCQPGTITLQQQAFRMVDHVEFSTPKIVEDFLNFWRSSGCQRFGYMYGRYAPYLEIPLGIKAIVEAIYEPPQVGEADGVTLEMPWTGQGDVDGVAKMCGLRPLGVIYTDLTDDGAGKGTVLSKRHATSFFLSSLEITFAAQLQAKHPAVCKWSDSGRFGSKFVTCVVSGNEDGGIDVASYQASNSTVAMINADLVEPSVDPGQMLVKEEGPSRYVPEVFFRRINEYGANIAENAKPAFPVDYLIVTLTHGFPSQPNPLFTAATAQFPIENRQVVGKAQSLDALALQIGVAPGSIDETTLDAVSDFHLLNYVRSLGILSREEEQLLAEVAAQHRIEDGYRLLETAGWQNLLAILRESQHA